MIEFVNRQDELALLEAEWQRTGGRFVVIHGRRRVGKTRMLKEFTQNKKGIFHVAADTNSKIQLNEFKETVASFYHDEFLRQADIKDWKMMFDYLPKVIDPKERVYIWIDEFTYLVKNDNSIVSLLQIFIDHFLREKSNLFFIISGSLFGMMSEKVLSHSSPLYGRRNRDILLQPLSFKHSLPFFNKCSFEEALKIFLYIGGIPEYLLAAEPYRDSTNFLEKEFLNRNGYFYREPYFILSQEFKEIKTYFSILNAVAYGSSKPSDIAAFTGLNAREIYPYLELLISYRFLKREVPGIGNDKKGIYLLEDPFFDTWFNCVHKNRNEIEQGDVSLDKATLNKLLGKLFEKFIRDHLFYFFNDFKVAGRWWYRDVEIDIVSTNDERNEVLFGECKWKKNVQAGSLLKDLAEKAQFVGWKKNQRTNKFALFAVSFKEKITAWQGYEVICFDLEDLQRIFAS